MAERSSARPGAGIAETAPLYTAADTTRRDAVVTARDSKPPYGTWRPVTAVREADRGGDPATLADPRREACNAPPHPDHLGGHATSGGAPMGTLTRLFGTSRVGLLVPSRGTGTTRHYRHARDHNRDAVNARGWAGIHTRFADTVGNATGQRLSAWALER